MSKPSARPSKIQKQTEPFNLDVLEKESSGNEFEFTLGDRVWHMTPLGRFDKKLVRRIARQANEAGDTDEVEYMDQMLKAAMGEEQFAEFDELPLTMEGLTALFEAWTEHSGLTPGESEAS